jgi:hypothetical protein
MQQKDHHISRCDGNMSRGDNLPPSTKMQLSAWGWTSLLASLVLGVTLAILHPALGALYLLFVAVGFLVGIPGGMRYNADVDMFLSNHPELNHSDLPWPKNYAELNWRQAWLYTKRGLLGAIIYGLLMPVFLVLGALIHVGLLNGNVLDSLYRA